eukprot:1572862-Pleurochrysis_carterae.AAC.2
MTKCGRVEKRKGGVEMGQMDTATLNSSTGASGLSRCPVSAWMLVWLGCGPVRFRCARRGLHFERRGHTKRTDVARVRALTECRVPSIADGEITLPKRRLIGQGDTGGRLVRREAGSMRNCA